MLLALLSFSLLGVLHKVADVKQSRPERDQRAAGQLVAAVRVRCSCVLRARRPDRRLRRRVVADRRFRSGSAASIAILAFQAGVKHGNIATSWLAINLSAGIPTVASILIYDEP